MIHSLTLHNFKCFVDLQLEIGPLTLLTGLNGMGKSSVIQSLLLLRQSHQQDFLNPISLRHKEYKGGLLLNGDLLSLGTANDVYCEFADDNEIRIGLDFRERSEGWKFCYEDPNTNLLDLILEPIDIPVENIRRELERSGMSRERTVQLLQNRQRMMDARLLEEQPLFNNNFQYLQAERFGPRLSFATSDDQVRQRRQLGSHGELTVHFLSVFGESEEVAKEMCHEKAASTKLEAQVEAWLSEISPGTRLNITSNFDTDSVSVRFGYIEGKSVSRAYRATNVGFGLSYLLPILVALLSAKRGSLLLLENPEAHLHPRGQSMMGRLMALAAKSGVQILVETHSDHVLNGIRLAVHDKELEPDAVRVHFFGREEIDGLPRAAVQSPKIDSNGRISQWPQGFFDEWDKNLSRLLLPPGFALNS